MSDATFNATTRLRPMSSRALVLRGREYGTTLISIHVDEEVEALLRLRAMLCFLSTLVVHESSLL